MAARVLTDRYIRGLKPPATGLVNHYDAKVPGLHLRLAASGARSWRYVYRPKGSAAQKVLTLGPGILSLAEARRLARDAAGRVARGEDPAADRDMARREAKDAASIEALVDRFLNTSLRPRVEAGKRSAAYLYETTRLLRREVLPTWGRRKAKDVTRRDVKALLTDIAARPAPITANRTRAALSTFFAWCLDADVLDTSPAWRVPAPGEETERQRVLTTTEIRALWTACDAMDDMGRRLVSPLVAGVIRLRLLTAQRGGEVLGLRWDELDEAGEWWTLPPARVKNRLAHRVPLSPQARAVLNALPRVGVHVFPGRAAGRPLCTVRHAWPTLREAAKLTDAVPHDLRRTAASGMASLGVPRLVIAKVLNHVEPGVTRVYDRHTYDPEKRDALTKWGHQVDAILAGERGQAEVTPLRGSPIPLHPATDAASAAR